PTHNGGRISLLRALLDGGDRFRAFRRTLFAKNAMEDTSLYEERIRLVQYTNHAGAIISVLGALLFAEAPALSGLEGRYWEALWMDCDGKGTSWKQFWRERFRDAQAGQHAWVWINLPARNAEAPAPTNRAEEEQAGYLDGYLVGLTPEQVIDWETDAQGALQWVLFRSIEQKRAGPAEPRKTVWKWTYIDAAVIRRWQWTPKPEQAEPTEEDTAQELEPIEHKLGQLPVVRMTMPADLWAMGKLEDPAIAACRARNELSWALHRAANELLVITSKWDEGHVVLGHGAYLKLRRDEKGSDSAQYVAPSGVAFSHLQTDVASTRDEVYRVVQQMALSADADAARQRLSGESKSQDWKATEIVLGSYADLVRQAMRNTVRFIAKNIRGEQVETVSISGLDGWSEEDLLTFLDAAALAVDARSFSPTFRKVVAKRQARRLLQDEVDEGTLREIETEIDEADVEALDPLGGFRAPAGEPPPNDPPSGEGGNAE
ncbi:MAG: hypothetical protein AAFV53_27505, partial [Myxococcota bacterium]